MRTLIKEEVTAIFCSILVDSYIGEFEIIGEERKALTDARKDILSKVSFAFGNGLKYNSEDFSNAGKTIIKMMNRLDKSLKVNNFHVAIYLINLIIGESPTNIHLKQLNYIVDEMLRKYKKWGDGSRKYKELCYSSDVTANNIAYLFGFKDTHEYTLKEWVDKKDKIKNLLKKAGA